MTTMNDPTSYTVHDRATDERVGKPYPKIDAAIGAAFRRLDHERQASTVRGWRADGSQCVPLVIDRG